MNKNFLLASIVGGVTFFILGWLVYGLLLMDFFQANAGSATGVDREVPVWWALGLGQLLWAAFLAYIYSRWAGISTFGGGAKAGFVLGLLSVSAFDLSMFGTTHITTLNAVAVDIVAGSIMVAIGGGVIGAVLGMGGGSDSNGSGGEAYSSM